MAKINKSIITYDSILRSERVQEALPYDWWANYVYHFSEVHNIASILNEGIIYSREKATNLSKMFNDNASKPVLGNTNDIVKKCVRFYFRPKTPTQYHNEGVRHPSELLGKHTAHCPVPVFLLFDSVKMLEKNDSFFTYEGLGNNKTRAIYHTPEDFKKFPFEHIYHDDLINKSEKALITRRRHAELIIPKHCDLKYLKWIICRSKAEKETLISLLEGNAKLIWEDKIDVILPELINQMYMNKYVFINTVTLNSNKIIINFNNVNQLERNLDISIKSTLNSKSMKINKKSILTNNLVINLPTDIHVDSSVVVTIRIDGNIACKGIYIVNKY